MAENKVGTKECTAESLTARESSGAKRIYMPRVDVYETKDSIVLVADMPGVDDKSLDITLEKDTLRIKGTVATDGLKDHRVYRVEYGVGDYERVFRIGEAVDHDHIAASMKDGLLNVMLPKAEAVKAKKIPVTMM